MKIRKLFYNSYLPMAEYHVCKRSVVQLYTAHHVWIGIRLQVLTTPTSMQCSRYMYMYMYIVNACEWYEDGMSF